jgi:hypothetical protein
VKNGNDADTQTIFRTHPCLYVYAAARSKFARRMRLLPPRSKRGIRAESGRKSGGRVEIDPEWTARKCEREAGTLCFTCRTTHSSQNRLRRKDLIAASWSSAGKRGDNPSIRKGSGHQAAKFHLGARSQCHRYRSQGPEIQHSRSSHPARIVSAHKLSHCAAKGSPIATTLAISSRLSCSEIIVLLRSGPGRGVRGYVILA